MDENTVVHLAKRHGPPIHREIADTFFLIGLALLCIYSVTAAISVYYARARPVLRFIQSNVLMIAVWTILCLWGLLYHVAADWIQIARRAGQLAVGTSCLTIFLAFKPAVLPQTYQVPLTAMHKWIGRTAVLFASFHGSVYFVSYTLEARHAKAAEAAKAAAATGAAADLSARHGGHHHHLFSLFNSFGIISEIAFLVIFVSSLGPVHRRAYYLFYALHWPLVLAINILLIWHARPQTYLLVGIAIALMGLQAVVRALGTRKVTLTNVVSYGPNMKLVTFNPPVPVTQLRGPGSQVRLSTSILYPLTWFRPSHPYTLIGDNRLVVRESRFRLVEGENYSLWRPFASSFRPEEFSQIVGIAGGSGISFIASLAAAKLSLPMKFIWVTRNPAEVPILQALDVSECDVYVTNSVSTASEENSAEDFELQEFEVDEDVEGDDDGLLRRVESQKGDIRRFSGRPDLNKALGSSLKGSDSQACVMACGPDRLVSDVSAWSSRQNNPCTFWSEVYAL